MQTIMIDGAKYSSADKLHQALKMMLNLPEYYGKNADALKDCVEEKREPVNVWVRSLGEGETRQALVRCLHVLEDLGGEIKDITN